VLHRSVGGMRQDAVVSATTTDTSAGSLLLAGSVNDFPRLRYMGSKYRLVPHLTDVFSQLGGTTALDAFSGSGIVSYLLKALGYEVTSNDFLTFPTFIARATVVNQDQVLTTADIDQICGPPADDGQAGPRKERNQIDGMYTLSTLPSFRADLQQAARLRGLLTARRNSRS